MKTFEEKWTAWVDGELKRCGARRVRGFARRSSRGRSGENQAHKLGALLKEQLQPRAMSNEEFFHHQLRSRIAAEMKESVRRVRPIDSYVRAGGPFVVCSGPARHRSRIFVGLHLFRHARTTGARSQSQYFDADLKRPRRSHASSPHATVSIFQTKQDRVTVLWVDGLKSLPSDYAAK